VFELQPSIYSTAAARIAYMANLTMGRARRSVMAGREGAAAYMQDYRALVAEFKTTTSTVKTRPQLSLCSSRG